MQTFLVSFNLVERLFNIGPKSIALGINGSTKISAQDGLDIEMLIPRLDNCFL